ncbi:MAG: hypothetical protein JW742_02230 [Candidatus Aminicenantes bacterium]|nr:hypothetical protein [Candidatus Aminicenantes bacterium]
MPFKVPRWSDVLAIVGLGIVLLMLILVLASCESIFGPDSDDDDDDTSGDEIARIVVANGYGETLDIYMDGAFQFALGDDETKKIKDVSLDEHDLEAKRLGTAAVVDDTTIDVTSYTDYSWSIGDPPDINVINNYGTALKIYLNDVFQFELADDEDRWIMNVAFGEYFLKAYRVDSGREVASTTIDVDGNKDYTWTIK